MPLRRTDVSEIETLASRSRPSCSISSNAAASKRCGTPRANAIWSATSTPPAMPRAASMRRARTAGSETFPDSVRRETFRSAFHTNGLASSMMRVWSCTSRTPGTASAIATELRRPSSENASAETVRSRPAASTRVLSRMVSRSESAVRDARSVSKATVLNHAASPQRIARGINPGHHLRTTLSNVRMKVPSTRAPQNKPARGCQIANEGLPQCPRFRAIANRFFNAFWHLGRVEPGTVPASLLSPETMSQLRSSIFRAGLEALYFSGAHRLLRPLFAGVGTIFMLHHVRPARERRLPAQPAPGNHAGFPARDACACARVRHRHRQPRRDAPADARARLRAPLRLLHLRRRLPRQPRFCAAGDARVRAPFTVYVASDFASDTGKLWWVALERLIARADVVEAPIDGETRRLDCSQCRGQARGLCRHARLAAQHAFGYGRQSHGLRPLPPPRPRRLADRARAVHVMGRAEGLRRRSAGDDRRAHAEPLQHRQMHVRHGRARDRRQPRQHRGETEPAGRCTSPILTATRARPTARDFRDRAQARLQDGRHHPTRHAVCGKRRAHDRAAAAVAERQLPGRAAA